MDEGYIKFNCIRKKASPPDSAAVEEINLYRSKLRNLGLIGQYPDGVGFGNISLRHQNNTFIITGSGTGGLPTITGEHCTLVTSYDLAGNTLHCSGPIRSSSESLTHAAIYESLPGIMAVIHVHHGPVWEKWLNKLPTTNPEATFGSPEMAYAIQDLLKSSTTRAVKMVVMGGHPEGLISYGNSLSEAYAVLLSYFQDLP